MMERCKQNDGFIVLTLMLSLLNTEDVLILLFGVLASLEYPLLFQISHQANLFQLTYYQLQT